MKTTKHILNRSLCIPVLKSMSFCLRMNLLPNAVFFLLYRKIIEVKIIDDEEYEKNKTFTVELGEPVLLEIGQKHGRHVCLLCGFVSVT